MTRRVTLKLEVTFMDAEDTGLDPLKSILDLIALKLRSPILDENAGTVMTVYDLHGRDGTKATMITTSELTHSYEQ